MLLSFASMPDEPEKQNIASRAGASRIHSTEKRIDSYFSADVETDGPIPGPYSILSFALVYVGTFDGEQFERANNPATFYRELKPISNGLAR